MADPTAPTIDLGGGPPLPPEYEEPQPIEESAPVDVEPGEVDEQDEPLGRGEPSVEEELEPKELPVERVLVDSRGKSVVYVQQPLRWFGKIKLYGVLGRAVEAVLEGDNPLGLGDVLDLANPRKMIDELMGRMPGADTMPDRDESPDAEVEAAKMMAAFAKVVTLAPDLLPEAYCIILNTPLLHKKWLLEWGLPEMDDEMGRDILETFVDQNWGVMEDFLINELPRIIRRAAKARERHRAAGARSKR